MSFLDKGLLLTELEYKILLKRETDDRISSISKNINAMVEENKELEDLRILSEKLEAEINVLEANKHLEENKKLIEVKNKKLKFYRKAEKASIIGDTVGDPMKDTSGPSLNILIKLSSIISVVFGPLFLKTSYLSK